MDNFNYGAEPIPDKDQFILWPTEGERTALLDADMLPYIVGFCTPLDVYFRATQKAKVLVTPGAIFDTEEFKNAANHLNWLVNHWVELAGADSAKLFMTDSAANFRLDIAFTREYKGTRAEEKPPFFYELRAYLVSQHNAIMSEGNEADDMLSIEHLKECKKNRLKPGTSQHKIFAARTVVVSKDKDLAITPGWYLNPDSPHGVIWVDELGELLPEWGEKEVNDYEYHPLVDGQPVSPLELDGLGLEADTWTRGAKAGQVKTKRVCVGRKCVPELKKLKGTGLKFFYSQLITGDNVDNYSGIPKKGMKAALEALEDCTSGRELYDVVHQMYADHYTIGSLSAVCRVPNYRGGYAKLTALQMMLEQGRLAHMQRFAGDIWMEYQSCPCGKDEIWTT